LIYLSSTSVYGASNFIVEKGTEPNPQTFYGISKLRGEGHVKRISNKINTYILRCGNVYGYSKSMRFDAVINKFMFEANYNRKISVNGDGMQYRSFIHIDKVSEVLHKISEGGLLSETYHLTDLNLSVVEIIDELKELYPDLEMIFVNQHMKLKEIRVTSDEQINQLITLKNSFITELNQFKERFTF
jgi:UDP-glucose 4-epimerase